MASILCFRMHQKTTDTEYGVVHYETESGIVKRPNGKSVEQTLSECVLMEPVVGTQVPGFNIDATSFAGKSYNEVIADAKKNVDAVTLGGMSKDQIIASVPGYVHPSTKQCSYAYSHPRTKQCSYEYIHPEAKQCNYEVDIDEIVKQVKESADMGGKLVWSGLVEGGGKTVPEYDYFIIRAYESGTNNGSNYTISKNLNIICKAGCSSDRGVRVVGLSSNGPSFYTTMYIVFASSSTSISAGGGDKMYVECYKY